MSNSLPVADRIAEIYRAESRRVLATLTRLLGDLDRAEEALHEAFRVALEVWPRDGIPRSPRSWLVSTGRFKAIDALRRRSRGRELEIEAAGERFSTDDGEWDGETVEDDQLRLIFTCCHPALLLDGRIALALREVCGLKTEEIAGAYLVSYEAMKRRISRAKAVIREKRIPYEIPSRGELERRLAAVLHVIYLVYNEGYAARRGDEHIRKELTNEAIFLARLVVDLIPHHETHGLLALLLLHESRSATRVDLRGEPVALEDQDRSAWDSELITEGLQHLQRAVMSGRAGVYTVQAAIVSVHATADSVAATNWGLIVGYYDTLLEMARSPVVELQRGIALGMRDGPEAALEVIDDLITRDVLERYHALYAAQADFLQRLGDREGAAAAYRRAVELASDTPERRYLERRLAEILP